MQKLEIILVWIGLLGYLLGFALLLTSLTFRRSRFTKPGWYMSWLAFFAHTLAIVTRWIASGHPPVEGNYENALLGTWFIGGIFLAGTLKHRRIMGMGVLINPIILFILGMGLQTKTELVPLSPPYQSNWLWIHVGFAWLAFSAFFAAFVLAVIYLWKAKYSGKKNGFPAQFPELPVIDDLMLGFIAFGFISQGLQIAAGAFWASSLWGSYWSWDPIETWSLICWLTYGLTLHLRLTQNWRGSRLAWLSLLAVVTEIVSFWGLGIGTGPHTPLL
ncbi:MAG: cytochrome c biogenesis protein CcsA [Carboxydocellales bacterium]